MRSQQTHSAEKEKEREREGWSGGGGQTDRQTETERETNTGTEDEDERLTEQSRAAIIRVTEALGCRPRIHSVCALGGSEGRLAIDPSGGHLEASTER